MLPRWGLLQLIRCRKASMPAHTLPFRPTSLTKPSTKRKRSRMSNRTRHYRQSKARRARRKKDKVSTSPTVSRIGRERIASRTQAWIRNSLPLSNSSRTSLTSVPKWALNLSLQIGNGWMSGTRTTSTRIWLSSITQATGSVSGQHPLSISEMRT